MKPIYTKFFGDQEKAKSLLPKARSRILHLSQKAGEFFGGVRIDRSLWDGVEIVVYEYQDLYVISLTAPLRKGGVESKGGVWCVPVEDYTVVAGKGAGGYTGNGESVDLLFESQKWRYEGSWSHMTLVPKDASRGVEGPNDPSTISATGPDDTAVDPQYAYYVFNDYGVGQRGNTHQYHSGSDTYLSWDQGWKDVENIGLTTKDVELGQVGTLANRYFGVPAGTQFYWNGHRLGSCPKYTTEIARYIIGAALIGNREEGLTVVAVIADFDDPINYTYLSQFNSIRTSKAAVWKRSFPGLQSPNFSWPDDGAESGAPDPSDPSAEPATSGWEKIADIEIPQKWKYDSYQWTYEISGDDDWFYWALYSRFEGVAAWNDNPPRDRNGVPTYQFAGRIAATAGLEWDYSETIRDPNVTDPIDIQKTQQCGAAASAAFYTININADLTEVTVDWEDVAYHPREAPVYFNTTPWDMGFNPYITGKHSGDGWVKNAIDFRNGEKVYLEGRAFIDEAFYTDIEISGVRKFNAKQQIRWCGHTFTGTFHKYFYYECPTDNPQYPDGEAQGFYSQDIDSQEFIILGLDMRYDRAWVMSYYVEKRAVYSGIPSVLEYVSTGVQNGSHYLIKGQDINDPSSVNEIVHMYDEFDGPQALPTPYNLNGDISVPASPYNTLRDACSSYPNEDNALNWIASTNRFVFPMSINQVHNGFDGSNREIRAPGTNYRNVVSWDAGRIQHAVLGPGFMHNGDVICGKVESYYGFAGSSGELGSSWYMTGVAYPVRTASPGKKAIMWDTLNGLNSYVRTFNMPDNDSDCLWIGVIG